jgi:hypothetical protein
LFHLFHFPLFLWWHIKTMKKKVLRSGSFGFCEPTRETRTREQRERQRMGERERDRYRDVPNKRTILLQRQQRSKHKSAVYHSAFFCNCVNEIRLRIDCFDDFLQSNSIIPMFANRYVSKRLEDLFRWRVDHKNLKTHRDRLWYLLTV